ncbi:MAG TPA: hypothetical protein VKQ89_02905 [Candidatus Angelobacter sp.]|nr:hypothetical protein [Candidatus Angelobacter sp.]
MHITTLALFLQLSRTATAMCAAGLALFLIAVWVARPRVAAACGLDKLLALTRLCFAVPLAVFGMLHFFGSQFVQDLVPPYMPFGRMFWVYFVGCGLVAASLSFATGIAVRWSGLLVGIMMFGFVAMLYLPSGLKILHKLALHQSVPPTARFTWTIVFRESSFGGAAWILAALAAASWPRPLRSTLITVGRIAITLALIFFAIYHFLHPLGLPGVPLKREMPAWVPMPRFIDYLTGAALIAAAASVLLPSKTRAVAACVGGWILLTIVVIYLPLMITALFSPEIGEQVEGINYFADTLLFAGVVLSFAGAASHKTESPQIAFAT